MKFLQDCIATTSMLANHTDVIAFCVAGSALYHEDPKDLDFLVLVKDGPPALPAQSIDGYGFDDDQAGTGFSGHARWLFGTGWDTCSGEYDDQDDKWGAIRKDNVNLIVTVDPDWYARAKLANEVCVALKLQDKADRIVVYRVVLDGYDAEQANARRDGRS